MLFKINALLLSLSEVPSSCIMLEMTFNYVNGVTVGVEEGIYLFKLAMCHLYYTKKGKVNRQLPVTIN